MYVPAASGYHYIICISIIVLLVITIVMVMLVLLWVGFVCMMISSTVGTMVIASISVILTVCMLVCMRFIITDVVIMITNTYQSYEQHAYS